MPKSSLTFIKLGGAVITNKEIPNQMREEVLFRLVQEIGRARKQTNQTFIVGNGAGSFAHVPAAHYKTMDGFINSESKMGMAITQDSAARGNREVVKAFLIEEMPAVTVAPSNSIVTKNRAADSSFIDVIDEYIRLGMIPVTYGDVLVDREQGCTIWSTDTVFNFLAGEFQTKGWQIDQIIHVTEAEGVWPMHDGQFVMHNGRKVIYPAITPDMRDEVRASMTDTKGFDVTGGMWHKIQESLSLAEAGITTKIISGLKPNALYNTLMGDQSEGTTITADVNYAAKLTNSAAHRHHHGWQSAVGAAA